MPCVSSYHYGRNKGDKSRFLIMNLRGNNSFFNSPCVMLSDWMLICYYYFRSIIPEMYNGAKEFLKEELSTVEFVAMTTDEWTSRSTKQYMAVTLHWLTEAMNIKSTVVDVHRITSTTSENLAECLNEVMREWSINKKVETIVTDSAPNKRAVYLLEQKTCPVLCTSPQPNKAHAGEARRDKRNTTP